MKPTDFPKRDWPLYFDGSWLMHKKLGPGRARVGDGRIDFRAYNSPRTITVDPDLVETWWPRGGAYNVRINNKWYAVYVIRKAARSMRKSAVDGHYYGISWMLQPVINSGLKAIAMAGKYIDGANALGMLRQGSRTSVAINRQVILCTRREYPPMEYDPEHWGNPIEQGEVKRIKKIKVVYRGRECAELHPENGLMMDDPSDTALSKLVAASLFKEGVA